MSQQQREALLLALKALQAEAGWAWKVALEGHEPDLVALQRSWNQVVQVVMEMEQR